MSTTDIRKFQVSQASVYYWLLTVGMSCTLLPSWYNATILRFLRGPLFSLFLKTCLAALKRSTKKGGGWSNSSAYIFFFCLEMCMLCSLTEKGCVSKNCEPANAKGICYIGGFLTMQCRDHGLKWTTVSHCFFCLKKKSYAVKLVYFASLLYVKCKDVTLINIFFFTYLKLFLLRR